MALKDQVTAALRSVMDPLGQDIVTSGRAAGIAVKNEGTPEASVGLVLSVDGIDKTTAERLQATVEAAINRVVGHGAARIILTADRNSAPAAAARPAILSAVAARSGEKAESERSSEIASEARTGSPG